MRFQTSPPESLEDMFASVVPGYWFHCPDVAAVDECLAELLSWTSPTSGLVPARQRAARHDMDRLLDLRLALGER